MKIKLPSIDKLLCSIIKGRDSLEHRIVPDAEDVVLAYSFCKLLIDFRSSTQYIGLIKSNMGKTQFLHLFTDEEKDMIVKVAESVTESILRFSELSTLIENFLHECLRKYVWLRYYAFLPIANTLQLLTLMAFPPTLIYTNSELRIRFNTWKNRIVPLKGSKYTLSIPGKLYLSYIYLRTFGIGRPSTEKILRLAEKCHEKLKTVTMVKQLIDRETRSVEKKLNGKINVKIVALRVLRDFARICISNTYLVAWWNLAIKHVDKEKCVVDPEKNPELPYELAKMPGNVVHYLEPKDIVREDLYETATQLIPDLEKITWREIVKKALNV